MRNVVMTVLSISGLFLACESRDNRVAPSKDRLISLPKITHDVAHVPTNPEGGKLPDKRPQLTVEENARRQSLNSAAPIVWGESVAGISFKTTQRESEDILANPTAIYERDGRYMYPESIHVFWEGEAAITAGLILVFDGYKGSMSLPEPYKSLELGANYAAFLKKPEDRNAMLQVMGSQFVGKAAPYNCLEQLDCSVDTEADGSVIFNFGKGYLLFDKDSKLSLMAMFPVARKLASTLPFVYGESMAGVTLANTRAEIESRFGPQTNPQTEFGIFDRNGLVAIWDAAGAVSHLILTENSKSPIPMPEGAVMMGSSFAFRTPAGDDGRELTLLLDRHFEKRAEGFNCLEATPQPKCDFKATERSLDVYLEKAIFRFTPHADRKLFEIQMFKN